MNSLKEILDSITLEIQMDRLCTLYSTHEELKLVDQNISFVLNKARKYVKGPHHNIPFSKEKEKRQAILLY